jgi:hypothetical protein
MEWEVSSILRMILMPERLIIPYETVIMWEIRGILRTAPIVIILTETKTLLANITRDFSELEVLKEMSLMKAMISADPATEAHLRERVTSWAEIMSVVSPVWQLTM